MSLDEADGLAEWLRARDRDLDDRRLCIECAHFQRGRCLKWQAAGFVRNAPLGDYADTLKRCPAFASATPEIATAANFCPQ